MEKCVVTVNGKDSVGIIAKVCIYMAENHINILDVDQRADNGVFHMTAVTDIEKAEKSLDTLAAELKDIGMQIGVDIQCRSGEEV